MNIAMCTIDGKIYTAIEFACLPADILEKLRCELQCPKCHSTAFFRNASLNGHRSPCFGARPHALGCSMAAQDYVIPESGDNNDQDVLLNPESKIIVDFQFGSHAQPEFVEYVEPSALLGRSSFNNGYRPAAKIHRRVSSLLRLLVGYPSFMNSNQTVVIHGNEVPVKDLFVPLQYVNAQYLGQTKGYWGLLSDARQSEDKTSVWFNGGGRENVSFRLSSYLLDDFCNRYWFNDLEDFSGAFILFFGKLLCSPRKNLYCEIDDLAFLALKFT